MASSVAASKILDEREEKLSTLTKPKLHIAGFDFSELAKLFLKDEANSGRGEDPRSVGGAGPPPPSPTPGGSAPRPPHPSGISGAPPPPPPAPEGRQGKGLRVGNLSWGGLRKFWITKMMTCFASKNELCHKREKLQIYSSYSC